MATRFLARSWLCVFLALLPFTALGAKEPFEKFLSALRKAGYHEEAIEYLDFIEKSDALEPEELAIVPYERCRTILDQLRGLRDFAARDRMLDEAAASLKNFLEKSPDHPLTSDARNQEANILVQRAVVKIERSKRPNAPKDQLVADARDLLKRAIDAFKNQEDILKERYTALQRAGKGVNEEVLAIRADYETSLLLGSDASERIAETYSSDSAEFKASLQAASEKYATIFEKYRKRSSGILARLYQARCQIKLGEHRTALGYLEECFEQLPIHDLQSYKTIAIILAFDCWEKLDQLPAGIATGAEWLSSAPESAQREPEFLTLRYRFAKAAIAHADHLKETEPNNADIPLLIKEARQNLRAASRGRSDLKDMAQELLTKIGAQTENVASEQKLPKTFEDAKRFGEEAVRELQTAQLAVTTIKKQLAESTTPERENELKEAQEKVDQILAYAKTCFETAQRLAPIDTTAEDLATIRYYLCSIAFQRREFFEAAVLGEYVARREPDNFGAKKCAVMSLYAYQQLYVQADPTDRQTEANKVENVAEYLLNKWPRESEAEDAIKTVIPFLIQSKQLDKAKQYAERLPADSPHRGLAELKSGQALWSSYLGEVREIERARSSLDDSIDPTAATAERATLAKRLRDLEGRKGDAQSVLERGVERMRGSGEPTPILIAAIHSLAQIYVDTNQSAKAIALLEEPKTGPLTLAFAKDPLTDREGFREEIFSTSIRAFVSSLSGANSNDQAMKKTRNIMAALKSEVTQDQAGQKRLLGAYLGLARDLKAQLDIAPPEQRATLGQGFQLFLDQIAKEADQLNVLEWVAETYRGITESLGKDVNGRLKPEAEVFQKSAAATYEKIVGLLKSKDFKGAPSDRIRLLRNYAIVQRDGRKFKESIDLFEEVLTVQPSLVNVQIEAAQTLTQWAAAWGTSDKGGKYFEQAIRGTRPDKTGKRNTIWGWAEIGNKSANDKRFLDSLYEARYELSLCYYQWSQVAPNDAARKKLNNDARKHISHTCKLYPDVMKSPWRDKLDALARAVQKAAGESSPQGLSEFLEQPSAAQAAR